MPISSQHPNIKYIYDADSYSAIVPNWTRWWNYSARQLLYPLPLIQSPNSGLNPRAGVHHSIISPGPRRWPAWILAMLHHRCTWSTGSSLQTQSLFHLNRFPLHLPYSSQPTAPLQLAPKQSITTVNQKVTQHSKVNLIPASNDQPAWTISELTPHQHPLISYFFWANPKPRWELPSSACPPVCASIQLKTTPQPWPSAKEWKTK